MTDENKDLLDAYWEWLRRETRIRPIGIEWFEVTFPFLDVHNDYVQTFMKRRDGGFIHQD